MSDDPTTRACPCSCHDDMDFPDDARDACPDCHGTGRVPLTTDCAERTVCRSGLSYDHAAGSQPVAVRLVERAGPVIRAGRAPGLRKGSLGGGRRPAVHRPNPHRRPAGGAEGGGVTYLDWALVGAGVGIRAVPT